ncbi:monocarboxylate transporter 12-B-like isoform X2 [Amblyomma americanum]
MLFLDIFLGIVHGTCIGLLALFSVVINQHFYKYRAMASGISNAGFTIGGLVFPPVIQLLSDKYGIRGTFLLCGGAMLNSVAGAFLQRTPPRVRSEDSPPRATSDVTRDDGAVQDPDERDAMIESSEQRQENRCCGVTVAANGASGFADLPNDTDAQGNAGQEVQFSATKNFTLCSHEIDDDSTKVRMLNADDSARVEVVVKTPVPRNSSKQQTVGSKRAPLLVFLMLPKFYLISFSLSMILFNMSTYMTVIVDFAVDQGISQWNAVYLISAYAVADLLARLGSGWITDRKYLSKSTMMGSHFVLWGASLYLMPLCSPYSCQVALSVLSGWCNGSTLILIAVLFMELVGIDKLGVCFGIATTFAGLLGLARPSLIGFYRDTRGDYEGLFGLVGGVTLCMSLLWLCTYLREWCAHRTKGSSFSNKHPKQASLPTSKERTPRS